MTKRLLAIVMFMVCAAEAADWEITRQIKETNFLLRQANQEKRYQNFLSQVEYYAKNYPNECPPKPILSRDPRDWQHDIWLVDQWVKIATKWENEKEQQEAGMESVTQPVFSEAELEAKFQQRIAESQAKKDCVYPEALDPTHPIHEEAERIWKNIEQSGHALLNDPDAPFKVYEMAANRLGIKPTGKP
jgi:hypothetical protein